jgi:hypothetical protein
MTSLIQYERARAALAEATRVDEVLSIRDEVEHLKLYAKQINDRALLVDATDFQLRTERKLGIVLAAAREAGQIADGRPKKGVENNPIPRVTLSEAGIDKNLANRARQTSAISELAFEAMVSHARERIISGRAKIIDAPRPNEAGRVQPPGDLDYSPTPPWATRALIEHVFVHLARRGHCKFQKVWEPACGEGHIAEVLGEYFQHVYASDLHPWGYGDIGDFLTEHLEEFDWIITNPPFEDRVIKFIAHALDLAGTGVAMFLQLRYLEGIGRYEQIFRDRPPTIIAPFVERVPLVMGRYDPQASTTTAFMWLVWIKGAPPQAPFWIPPGSCKALTKPDDKRRFTTNPVTRKPTIGEPSAPIPQSDADFAQGARSNDGSPVAEGEAAA